MIETAPSPKVSIVVPCFNVAPYLDQCLKSLRNQSFPDIEIIAIDDGSTDETHSILLHHASEDARVRVFQQLNAGLSITRNNGSALARGEWVFFIDSDDWVEPDMVAMCLKAPNANMADMVVFSYLYFDETTGASLVPLDFHAWKFLKMNAVKSWYPTLHFDHVAWMKAYRRSFLDDNKLAFIPGKRYEDMLFAYQAARVATLTVFVSRHLYHYRQNRAGQITKDGSRRTFESIDVFREMLKGWSKDDPKFMAAYMGTFARVVPWLSGNLDLDFRRSYLEHAHHFMYEAFSREQIRSGLRRMSWEPMVSAMDMVRALIVFAPWPVVSAFLYLRRPVAYDWVRLACHCACVLGPWAGLAVFWKALRNLRTVGKEWAARRA